ncbi:hypothetical protein NLJ89_g6571 [Agrocybe chaxingu]|uniref:Uncharacterized protein n=1 Tax=Agrocybe chaxingu TaxID=84603 RepID=A0A9W8K665_9AGAR|nr:hypothetical protein NLJ89_g6571 [Agrocybe chaxingu]
MPSGSPTSSSSSPRSSETPPPTISPKQRTSKDKGKTKATAPGDHGKNEGVDLNWDYKPPAGAVLLNDKDEDAGEFDWDAVNDDDDVELWLIRVPEGIKPKHLVNLEVDVPSSSKSSCIGTLQRKHAAFDLWSVGDDDSQPIGGEEIKSLECLLPRKSKKGKLFPAPKPITHHIVIAAKAVTPTPPIDAGAMQYKNPSRHSYPNEVLKHKFMPTGSMVDVMNSHTEDVVMADIETTSTPEQPSPKKIHNKFLASVEPEHEVEKYTKKSKGKKRKGDVADTLETPAKKSKKSKSAS